MGYDIIVKVLVSLIVSIATGIFGFLLGKIKTYTTKIREKEDKILKEFEQIKESQLLDMKSDLSNKFFIYDALEEVEDYLVEGFREDCKRYFDLGGDSWIHPMYDKSFKWKLKQTGYLK